MSDGFTFILADLDRGRLAASLMPLLADGFVPLPWSRAVPDDPTWPLYDANGAWAVSGHALDDAYYDSEDLLLRVNRCHIQDGDRAETRAALVAAAGRLGFEGDNRRVYPTVRTLMWGPSAADQQVRDLALTAMTGISDAALLRLVRAAIVATDGGAWPPGKQFSWSMKAAGGTYTIRSSNAGIVAFDLTAEEARALMELGSVMFEREEPQIV